MPDTHVTKSEALYNALAEQFGDKVSVETETSDGSATVSPEHLKDVALHCRDGLGMDVLHLISGVDYLADAKIEVVYHLESFRRNTSLVLKCSLPREDPILPSVVDVWIAADWMERETYDLIGVLFEGHPNLRRILCSEDWEGHPLRKDYVMPAYYHGIPNVFFLEQLTEEQKKLLFGEMSEENRRLIYGE